MGSIVQDRDRTRNPSTYCSCGTALWLGRENNRHYLRNGHIMSEHDAQVERNQVFELKYAVDRAKICLDFLERER